MAVTLVTRRAPNGDYTVNDRYTIRKRKAAGMYESGVSWYWVDSRTPAKSGYFDTKAETLKDLDRHVNGGSDGDVL